MAYLTLKNWHALTGQWSDSSFLDLNRGNEDPAARGISPLMTTTLTSAEMYETVRTIPDNYGVATLWEDGDGGFTTYTSFWIESDKDVLLALSATGEATSERIKISAGAPVYLAENVVPTAGFVNETETTMASVDQITVQRNEADGEGDARVRLILFKDNSS
jgi:hypothetical protein